MWEKPLFLKFLGTRRHKGPKLMNHLTTGGTAGSLKSRMQALRQVQAQVLSGHGLLLKQQAAQPVMSHIAYCVIDEPRRIGFIIDVAAGAQGSKRDKYEGNA